MPSPVPTKPRRDEHKECSSARRFRGMMRERFVAKRLDSPHRSAARNGA
jgi:hypothetical protein